QVRGAELRRQATVELQVGVGGNGKREGRARLVGVIDGCGRGRPQQIKLTGLSASAAAVLDGGDGQGTGSVVVDLGVGLLNVAQAGRRLRSGERDSREPGDHDRSQ